MASEHVHQQIRDGGGQFIPTLQTAERRRRAAELRSQGLSYRKIAAEMGIDVKQAFDYVKHAMQSVIQTAGEEAVSFELTQLDEELVRLDALYETVTQVLEREHVTVSQGRVVTLDDAPVPDDDWILKAVDRLVRIDEARRRNGESRRRLLGLDQPAKTQISGGLTYEVVGIDPEELT